MQLLRLVILGILLVGCSSGSGSSPPITAPNNTTSGRTSATMQRSASSLGLVPDWHSSYKVVYAFAGTPDGEKPSGLGALDFHEKAGVCQAPTGVAVKVARLQHSATPFALLPSALLMSPVWGSVPVEVPRKGGCCHLGRTISKDQSLARSHPNAAVH
jgi:hypothetical protein